MVSDFAILGQSQTAGVASQSTPTAAVATQVAGNLMGHAVSETQTTSSLIADAAEELTFAHDNSDDLKLKERRQKDATPSSLLARVELYQRIMEQHSERYPMIETLKRFLRANHDSAAIFEKTKEAFPDPAEGWAILKNLRQALAEEGTSPDSLAAIDSALARMEQESMPAILASINGTLAASGFADLGDPLSLGKDYSKIIVDFPESLEMLRYLHGRFGSDDFETALNFMQKALAGDLAADVSSQDNVRLETIAGNLGHARILNSGFSLCLDMVQRWENVHQIKDHALSAEGLLSAVMETGKESYIPQSAIQDLTKKAAVPDIALEVLFLQELLRLTRSFSPQIFNGAEARMKYLDAVQNAVNDAVAREDEYLASLE